MIISGQVTSPDTVTASSTTTTAGIEPQTVEAAVGQAVIAAAPIAPVAAAAADKIETLTSTTTTCHPHPKPSFASLAVALKNASEKAAKEKVQRLDA